MNLAKCLCSLTYAYQILAYGCITMRQHVVYILDLSITLTSELYVGGGGILVSFTHSFYLVSTKHGPKHPSVKGIQVQMRGLFFPRGDNSKNTYLTTFENLSSGTRFSILD